MSQATPPPPPPPDSSGTPGGQAADVGIRLGAKVIDWIILTVVFAIVFVPLFLGAMFADATATEAFGVGVSFSIGGFVSSVVFTAVVIAYFALLENYRGQTLGKMLLNLRVVGPGGGNPSLEEAVRRNAWIGLAIIPFIGGLAQLAAAIAIAVTISQNVGHRGWHDDFAGGTQVLRTS